jgi:hypothetical protein
MIAKAKKTRNRLFLAHRPPFDSSPGHNLGHNYDLGRCVFRAEFKPIEFEMFDMAQKAPLDWNMVIALVRRETMEIVGEREYFDPFAHRWQYYS